jgi:hypothetical protein
VTEIPLDEAAEDGWTPEVPDLDRDRLCAIADGSLFTGKRAD